MFMARMGFLSMLAGVLPLVVDRLFIHPALLRAAGPEWFGMFIWWLGLMQWVGIATANGNALPLMLSMGPLSPLERDRQLARSLGVARFVVGLALILTAAICGISGNWPSDLGLLVAATLLLVGWTQGVFNVMSARLRVERAFGSLLAARALEAAVLLGMLVAVAQSPKLAAGVGYAVSSAVLLAMGGHLLRKRRVPGDVPLAPAISPPGEGLMWVTGVLFAVFEQGQVYASRLALGLSGDGRDVAILYAGVGMANMFLAPVSLVGQFMLSIISGKREQLAGREKGLLALANLCAAALIGLAVRHGGSWLVTNRYPEIAGQTLPFMTVIASSTAWMAAAILFRPLALRNQPLRICSALSGLCFTLQLVLLFFYQGKGVAGACAALNTSALCSAMAWALAALAGGKNTAGSRWGKAEAS